MLLPTKLIGRNAYLCAFYPILTGEGWDPIEPFWAIIGDSDHLVAYGARSVPLPYPVPQIDTLIHPRPQTDLHPRQLSMRTIDLTEGASQAFFDGDPGDPDLRRELLGLYRGCFNDFIHQWLFTACADYWEWLNQD